MGSRVLSIPENPTPPELCPDAARLFTAGERSALVWIPERGWEIRHTNGAIDVSTYEEVRYVSSGQRARGIPRPQER